MTAIEAQIRKASERKDARLLSESMDRLLATTAKDIDRTMFGRLAAMIRDTHAELVTHMRGESFRSQKAKGVYQIGATA